jgi:hypothetical protein
MTVPLDQAQRLNDSWVNAFGGWGIYPGSSPGVCAVVDWLLLAHFDDFWYNNLQADGVWRRGRGLMEAENGFGVV